MAVLSRGLTFGATETVTNTKLHNLVDDATISGIVDEDIDISADISPSKIGDIELANKVSGLSLFALPSTPAGAGRFPVWNMNLDIGASLASIPNTALIPLSMASLVHAIAIRSLASLPTTEQMPYNVLVQSLASGGIPRYNGLNNFVGSTEQGRVQIFTATGSFTAPAGVTKVYLTMSGGGGGGAGKNNSANSGGGGGGAEAVIKQAYTVVPGNSYTVTIGDAGSGGIGGSGAGAAGGNGGDTIFNDAETDGTPELVCTGGTGAGSNGTAGTGASAGTINGSSGTGVAGGFSSFAGGNGATGTSTTNAGSGGGCVLGVGGKSGNSGNGGAGGGFGSGGGGGHGASAGATPNGGAGGAGVCVVEW